MKKSQMYGIATIITLSIFSLIGGELYLLNRSIKSIEEAIDDLENSIDKNFDEMLSSIASIEKKIDMLSGQLDTMNNNLEALENLERNTKLYEEYQNALATLNTDAENYEIMCRELGEVKDYLHTSPDEFTKYVNILSIGDAVFFQNEDIEMYKDIYSLVASTNSVSSLYDNSEIRYIKEIIMADGKTVVEVDNMADYESYLALGYIVKGYNLVNRHSLVDGTLVDEGRVKEDSIKLVYTMN